MANLVAPVLMRGLISSAAKPAISGLADKATSSALGNIGKKVGGKSGQKVAKFAAKGLNKVRRGLLGFESGGKVRMVPVRGPSNNPSPGLVGYNVGGKVKRQHRRKK